MANNSIPQPEEWRPVFGYEKQYAVSSAGGVYSHKTQKYLKPQSIGGYLFVNLYDGGSARSMRCHTLVLRAFLGPRPDGHTASHKDGNSTNNAVGNLCYESHSANCRRKLEHGTTQDGERDGRAILSDADAVEIVRSYIPYSREFGNAAMAARYGVCRDTITNIVYGQRYRAVTEGIIRRRLVPRSEARTDRPCEEADQQPKF